MSDEEALMRHYLQTAHDQGGSWQTAMRMMASDLLDAREKAKDAQLPSADDVRGILKTE